MSEVVRITHKGLTELHRRLGGSKSLAIGRLSAVPSDTRGGTS